MKLYLDTSVYGGCFDEGMEASLELMEWIAANESVKVYYSDVLTDEFDMAPKFIQDRLYSVLNGIKNRSVLGLSDRSQLLALEYIALGIVTKKDMSDAQHIAIASLNRIDYILSWNYKHMVGREAMFIEASKKLGVHATKIIQPHNFLQKYGKK